MTADIFLLRILYGRSIPAV